MQLLETNKGNKDLLKHSKILIIEDDRAELTMLHQILLNFGFEQVFDAKNGKEGWEATLEHEPDLVLLDMNMPIMNGFEYIKKARDHEDFKEMIILVQTGLTNLEDKVKIFESGANDYVTKPLDPNEIAARSFIHLKNSLNLKELKEYNERVRRELDAANKLLDASLPNDESLKKLKKHYGIDIAAKFVSSQELGGDFWGFYPINQKQFAIYLIDVSGHGIDASLSALRIHSYLLANSEKDHKPGELLKWLNDKLCGMFPAGQFATMFFGIIDTENNTLMYSTAATTPPIVLHQNNLPIQSISGKGYPIGVLEESTFETNYIPFNTGDTLILYSDAIIEGLDEKKEFYGIEKLLKSIEKTLQTSKNKFSPKKTLNTILKDFHKTCGKKLLDDLTLNVYHRIF